MIGLSTRVVARSLSAAFELRATATHLLLAGSPDLRCMNLMCQHCGGGCACRLALALERMPALVELDVSGNSLTALPDLAASAPRLTTLRASRNLLSRLPPLPPTLVDVDLRENRLAFGDVAALVCSSAPSLRSALLAGCCGPAPLTPEQLARLAASNVAVDTGTAAVAQLL